MLFKKSKAVIAAAMAAAMASNAVIATAASAKDAGGTRTKAEKYGDSTYAERVLSLYDDVMTNGIANGYMSKNGKSGNIGIPFHSVEEVIVEAPDYGHVNTSEAMSYLVWMAAMRDNIAANHADQVSGTVDATKDLKDAWTVMENMVPSVQDSFWNNANGVSAQYCGEYDDAKDCPDHHAGEADKTASNPIYKVFCDAYSGDKGLYLMHWLGDVENWYGFGTGTEFTFINTFQRGESESCWEAIPQPCVEEKKAGNPDQGIKGIFNKDNPVTAQWAYTNAPDAEDRAIQGVYDANRWGVGDSSVSKLAGKMGDELRNNMFDKYYQAISPDTLYANWKSGNAGYDSCHYLMNWYTSWGGALKSTGQDWVWQIGCSHAHEFYQNPLAAYALITESDLKGGMLGKDAVKDYTTSLERQIEFYQWLQSESGMIAGGATNSYKGRYEAYPSGASTWHGMMYVAHPVYADPGSNHWIGNQVWAVQRLVELLYWVKEDSNGSIVKPGGVNLDEALDTIVSKWVAFMVNNTVLTEDGDYYMPSNLDWEGQPDPWSGSQSANTGLKATIIGYGNSDMGCATSLANSLIYFAKIKGVKASDVDGKKFDVGGSYKSGIDGVAAQGGTVYSASDADLAKASLYLGQQILDRTWDLGRDDIGLSRTEHNGSFARMFAQDVWVPQSYTGKMPNGDEIKNGIKFLDIRSQYIDASKCAGVKTSDEAVALVKELKEAYEKDVAAGADWANRSEISASSTEGRAALEEFKNVGAVDLHYHRFWHAGDILVANGVMANLYPELKPTIQYGESEQPTTEALGDVLYGDANCDGVVDVRDVIKLAKSVLGADSLTPQGQVNADVNLDGKADSDDVSFITKSLAQICTLPIK